MRQRLLFATILDAHVRRELAVLELIMSEEAGGGRVEALAEAVGEEFEQARCDDAEVCEIF